MRKHLSTLCSHILSNVAFFVNRFPQKANGMTEKSANALSIQTDCVKMKFSIEW